MGQMFLFFGVLISSYAFAGFAEVRGSATGHFEPIDKSFSNFISRLENAADGNALKSNWLCKLNQYRTSEYRISQITTDFVPKFRVDADYMCGDTDY